MKSVFLSASVPLPERDDAYGKTADVLSIREATKALVGEAVQHGQLVFGGHPAITPMIARMAAQMAPSQRERLILYQSSFFEEKFVPENSQFVQVRITKAVGRSRSRSLALMRDRMISETDFFAGVFIGGMDGVVDEFRLFRARHPSARLWPIASTGGAAMVVHEKMDRPQPDLFLNETTYQTLFRKLYDTAI